MRTGLTRYGDGQLLSVPALRKDGTRISVEFTIVPFLDPDGRMTGIAAIMRDATSSFEELRALRKGTPRWVRPGGLTRHVRRNRRVGPNQRVRTEPAQSHISRRSR